MGILIPAQDIIINLQRDNAFQPMIDSAYAKQQRQQCKTNRAAKTDAATARSLWKNFLQNYEVK